MALRLLLDLEFDKWARRTGLSHDAIRKAAAEVEEGLVDARLGGFLVKKRVPRESGGKRDGYRTIVAHRQGNRMIFLFGFGKNEADNINKEGKKALAKRGDIYMDYSSADIDELVKRHLVIEVRL